jgi:hypothetical protein
VGDVRDQDGVAVAGAPVAALDAGGATIARDRTARDGTFALSVAQHPSAVLVTADNAEPQRLAAPPGDRPLVVVVKRFRAIDLAPSAADVAALPSGALAALSAVAPYRVAFPTAISDRYLARGRGDVAIEGLPFYRRSDGLDATALLPAHATGTLALTAPDEAPWYGDRAIGGIVDARLFDREDVTRATDHDLHIRAGSTVEGFAAGSQEDDGQHFVAAAHGGFRLAGGSGDAIALTGTAASTRYAGVGTSLRYDTQRTALAAQAQLTRDDDGFASSNGTRDSVAAFALDGSGRGPNAIAVRARLRDENGPLADGSHSAHRDAALVVGMTRGQALRVRGTLALAYGRDETPESGTHDAVALLPSLGLDAPIGPTLSAHVGFVEATLGTPEAAIARSSLGEASLTYADRRRLLAQLVAYSEGDAAPRAHVRGIAGALGWEIAPRLSLRSWIFGTGDALVTQTYPYPGGPLSTQTFTRTIHRDLLWATWDAPLRIDVLLRSGGIEGALRIPIASRYAIVVESARSSRGIRFLSLGLTLRNP